MSESVEFLLPDADATNDCGEQLGRKLADRSGGLDIFLQGDLGAGKTTFTRGLLRGLGHQGRVPSPTYTLVEPYELASGPVFHMDLYRLQDGAELEFLGIDDLPAEALRIIEWPEKAAAELGQPDLLIKLSVRADGRQISMQAAGDFARQLLPRSV